MNPVVLLVAIVAEDPAVLRNDDVLMGAVDFGHQELAAWLLQSGASPNGRSSIGSGQTVLHSAAWEGNLALVKLLVEAGADVRALDHEHQGTPADWARYSHGVSRNPACLAVAEYLESLACRAP